MSLRHAIAGALALGALTVFGCGTGASTTTDGGCIAPVEGDSCSPNDIACQPQGDICCVGYSWICQSGKWFKAGVGCACQTQFDASSDAPQETSFDAGPFACGPQTTCDSAAQICVDQAPGIALADGGVPPDSFSCSALPAACATAHTCACVKAENPCPSTQVSSCDDTNGAVTVRCMGQ